MVGDASQFGDHCANFLKFIRESRANRPLEDDLPEFKSNYLDRSPASHQICDRLDRKNRSGISDHFRSEGRLRFGPRDSVNFMSVQQTGCRCDWPDHTDCIYRPDAALPSSCCGRRVCQAHGSPPVLAGGKRQQCPWNQAVCETGHATPGTKFKSRDTPEAAEPSPRSLSSVPSRLSEDEAKTSLERSMAKSQAPKLVQQVTTADRRPETSARAEGRGGESGSRAVRLDGGHDPKAAHGPAG